MWKEKTTTLSLKISEHVAAIWKLTAEREGHAGIAPWLKALAQGKVTELGVKLPKKRLKWKRGAFIVDLCGDLPDSQGPTEVKGIVAGPFGVFCGSKTGLCNQRYTYFTLVHLPTHETIATLGRQIDCRQLAQRLFTLKMNWNATNPKEVSGPEESEARSIIYTFQRRDHVKPSERTGYL
jgi:hypothetical protein